MAKASDGSNGAVYGLGVIGALFYFMQAAGSFGEVVVGIFKSLFWPAYVVFKLLETFYGKV